MIEGCPPLSPPYGSTSNGGVVTSILALFSGCDACLLRFLRSFGSIIARLLRCLTLFKKWGRSFKDWGLRSSDCAVLGGNLRGNWPSSRLLECLRSSSGDVWCVWSGWGRHRCTALLRTWCRCSGCWCRFLRVWVTERSACRCSGSPFRWGCRCQIPVGFWW